MRRLVMEADSGQAGRRRYQFALRTLMFAVVVLALACSWLAIEDAARPNGSGGRWRRSHECARRGPASAQQKRLVCLRCGLDGSVGTASIYDYQQLGGAFPCRMPDGCGGFWADEFLCRCCGSHPRDVMHGCLISRNSAVSLSSHASISSTRRSRLPGWRQALKWHFGLTGLVIPGPAGYRRRCLAGSAS